MNYHHSLILQVNRALWRQMQLSNFQGSLPFAVNEPKQILGYSTPRSKCCGKSCSISGWGFGNQNRSIRFLQAITTNKHELLEKDFRSEHYHQMRIGKSGIELNIIYLQNFSYAWQFSSLFSLSLLMTQKKWISLFLANPSVFQWQSPASL